MSTLIDVARRAGVSKSTVSNVIRGASLVADQRIHAGDYSDIPSSNVVVITAGLRRKPDESRLDLINRNVDLFVQILDDVITALRRLHQPGDARLGLLVGLGLGSRSQPIVSKRRD